MQPHQTRTARADVRDEHLERLVAELVGLGVFAHDLGLERVGALESVVHGRVDLLRELALEEGVDVG